jgi:flagellar hook-length control protein FliK
MTQLTFDNIPIIPAAKALSQEGPMPGGPGGDELFQQCLQQRLQRPPAKPDDDRPTRTDRPAQTRESESASTAKEKTSDQRTDQSAPHDEDAEKGSAAAESTDKNVEKDKEKEPESSADRKADETASKQDAKQSEDDTADGDEEHRKQKSTAQQDPSINIPPVQAIAAADASTGGNSTGVNPDDPKVDPSAPSQQTAADLNPIKSTQPVEQFAETAKPLLPQETANAKNGDPINGVAVNVDSPEISAGSKDANTQAAVENKVAKPEDLMLKDGDKNNSSLSLFAAGEPKTERYNIKQQAESAETDRAVAAGPATDANAIAVAAKAESLDIAAARMTLPADKKTDAKLEAVDSTKNSPADAQTGPLAGNNTNTSRTSPTGDAPQNQQTTNQSQVDNVRIVQRVARALEAAGERGGTVRLRLSPPELGSLRVEIAVRQGAMTARVEAEKSDTRNLLLDNLPALRDRLERQNIKIEQFQVDLMGQGSGGASDNASNQTPTDRYQNAYSPAAANRANRVEPQRAESPRAKVRTSGGTQLDVII